MEAEKKHQLYTEHEAATVLRVKPRTFEGWRQKGFGPPFVKIGHRVYYRLVDLEEYIESNLRTHTGQTRASVQTKDAAKKEKARAAAVPAVDAADPSESAPTAPRSRARQRSSATPPDAKAA